MRIVGPILLFSANPENLVILSLSLSLFLLKILTNLVTLALHVLISLSSAYSAKHGPNAYVFCCCNFISSHQEIPLLYIKTYTHQHKQTRLPFLFPRFLLNGSTSLVIPNHQAGTFTCWNLRILAVCVVMFSRGNRV